MTNEEKNNPTCSEYIEYLMELNEEYPHKLYLKNIQAIIANYGVEEFKKELVFLILKYPNLCSNRAKKLLSDGYRINL